jgi:hypothetical protein
MQFALHHTVWEGVTAPVTEEQPGFSGKTALSG